MAKFSDNSMASIVWLENQFALGALAKQTAIIDTTRIDNARLQGFRVLKIEYFMNIKSMTAGEGPILVGLAHGMAATVIATGIGADPQRSGDPSEIENAERPTFPLEILHANADGDGKVTAQGVWKNPWSIQEGTDLNWFVYNFGNADLTTGGIVQIIAKAFGIWLKD